MRLLRYLSLGIFILTLAISTVLPRIRIASSLDVFFDKSGRLYKNFTSWSKQFGSDDRIIIAWRDENLFTRQGLERIRYVTQSLEKMDFIEKVQSLSNLSDIWGQGEDFYAEPLLDREIDQKDIEWIKYRVKKNPLFLKNIVSEDLKSTSVVVFIGKGDSERRKQAIERIIKVADSLLEGLEHHVSGSAVVDYYYTEYMKQDLAKFLPIALALIFFLLLVLFRSIAGTFFPFVLIIVNLIWTMAVMYFLGFDMDNVTTIIPPIMLAISIADSVHFIATLRVYLARGIALLEAIWLTMQQLFLPCLMTSLTTAVGFLSLLVSKIEPIKHMGLVSSIGVVLAFIFTFTFLPGLILWFPYLLKGLNRTKNSARGQVYQGFTRLAGFVIANYRIILVLFLLVTSASLFYARRVTVETIMVNYFKQDTAVYKATRFIQNHFGGVQFINISLYSEKKGVMKDPDVLKRMDELKARLLSYEKVDKVISPADYIKLMNRAMHNDDDAFFKVPSSRAMIEQYLLLYDIDDLKDYVDRKWQWANIVVRTSESSSLKLTEQARQIQAMASKLFPEFRVELVGRSLLEAETNQLVSIGQVRSLSLAMVMIFAMILIVFKSVRIGLLSLVPNVVPLIMNFGIMGLLGIYLDSSTSIISAVGIGIIVDDTIHFLHSFVKNNLKYDKEKAIIEAMQDKGPAIVFTSVILFIGFGILSLSNFSPTSDFGFLSALLMLNALLADLFFLPSLLMLFGRKIAEGA